MFTFGIVMCFISAAIYGMVVYIQIKRIDRLESEQIINRDRINLYRERYQTINVFCHHLDERIHKIERHPFFLPLKMTAVSDFEPGDIHPFTPDTFVTTGEQSAEVA